MTNPRSRAQGAGKGRVDISQIRFWVPVEVRYSDLDAQGHVNNATFFTYFEQGRVAFFAELRARQHTPSMREQDTAAHSTIPGTEASDLPFVIANASCVYLRPVATLAPVVVGVRAARITHAAIEIEYAVCDRPVGGLLYATGSTLTVSIDPLTGRPRPLPAWTRLAPEDMPARPMSPP
jgi:acyl-CoA thioester hydrolase